MISSQIYNAIRLQIQNKLIQFIQLKALALGAYMAATTTLTRGKFEPEGWRSQARVWVLCGSIMKQGI